MNTEQKFQTVAKELQLCCTDMQRILDDIQIKITDWIQRGSDECSGGHYIEEDIQTLQAGLQIAFKHYVLLAGYHAETAHSGHFDPLTMRLLRAQTQNLEEWFARQQRMRQEAAEDAGVRPPDPAASDWMERLLNNFRSKKGE